MAKRDRLGRGLEALLGSYGEATSDARAQARMLPVAGVTPNPFQPRRDFSEQELAELAESIRANGLLQPIVVRPAGSGAKTPWELVAGERRWRAVTRLGWIEVPAMVRDIDDRTMLVLAMVENLQRSELTPLEEAEGYRRLMEEFALSQNQVAEMVGRNRSTVANAMRLLQLPASVRRLLSDGSLSAGHARALLGLGNDRRIAELARRAVENGWSVREVEGHVQKARSSGNRRARGRDETARDPAERQLEEALQRAFGAEVRIRRGRGLRGRIEIPFLGAEDFERVFELLAGLPVADVVS